MNTPSAMLLALALGGLIAAPTRAQWKSVAVPPVQRDALGFYERDTVLDALTEIGEWAVGTTDQNARATLALGEGAEAGASALEIGYAFEGRTPLEYAEVVRAIPLPAGTEALGIRVCGGEHPLPARVRLIDANGEWHQFDLGAVQPGLWSVAIADLSLNGGHWGGDDNGVLDAPARIHSILFDRAATGFAGSGSVRVADLATYRRVSSSDPHGFRIEIPAERARLVYEPGEAVRLRVGLEPAPGLAFPVTITATQVDPFGQEVWQDRWEAESAEPREVTIPQPETGGYDLRLRIEGDAGAGRPWADFRFAVLPQPGPVPEDSPFGFSTHFGQGWDPAWMDLLTRVGVRWYRDEISWGSVEPQKGTLALPEAALGWARRGRDLGLELLLILDYANAHYDDGGYPVSPEARAGFAGYGARAATELRGVAAHYEVWNEWCGGCGMGTRKGRAEDYAPLYLEAARAVREADPTARVVGIGGEYGGKEDVAHTLGTMMRDGAGAAMDAFSIHPYHYPGLPSAAFREHLEASLAAAAQAAGKPVPLWITEIGWPTNFGGNGSGFLHQARCLVRMYAIALGTPGVERVFWYDLRDDGTSLGYNEHNFGIVHNQEFLLAPKPAYAALAQLVDAVHGRAIESCVLGADGLWRLSLRGPDDRVWVVFADQLSARVAYDLPAGATRVTDLFGRARPAAPRMQIDGSPVFVWASE